MAFNIALTLLLLLEVLTVSLFIYKLSAKAIEGAAFSSHLNIERSTEIIKPIIIKVNIYFMFSSLLLASLWLAATYLKLHRLFARIITGIEEIKSNHTSFRLDLNGGKPARRLISEFNQAASFLDKRRMNLISLLDALLAEKDLEKIKQLHRRLYLIIAENNLN